MESQIIKGLIYSEVNEELGPDAKAWIPEDLTPVNLIHISVKTLAVLTGEKGHIPETLVILPYPSLGLKGLIKFIKWEDTARRGGIGQAALILLFQELADVIFYKYLKEFSKPFSEIAQNIIYLEKSNAKTQNFVNELVNLENSAEELIRKLEAQEIAQSIPETQKVDRRLIDYQFKVIVVGDPSVGKTSLILKYTDNAFRRSYVPTLGIHVSNKIFKLKGSIIQLVLWDLGGQERFETLRKRAFKGSDAVFLVFDLTNPDSFQNISKWHSDIQEHLKERSEDIIGFVIGNKKDLTDSIKINSENAQELADKFNFGYIETSALLGENVDYAFSKIAENLYISRS